MNVHMMPSKNIAVQATVYAALDREKRAAESFTQVIRRLLDSAGGADEMLGAWGVEHARTDHRVLSRLRRPGGSNR